MAGALKSGTMGKLAAASAASGAAVIGIYYTKAVEEWHRFIGMTPADTSKPGESK